uniref:NADH-ubiquinone oxidoreductase chain 6 n=1 Tax=Pneumocystis jirovecii TaxID=42068 RepID=A0A8E6Z822_PNEJI|nr:NADH dehydrogenase subunit 6 [Pneumocystis jirovecii]
MIMNVFYSTPLLTLLNVLGILFSILVVSSRNPVVSLLYLIALFVDVAVLLILMNLTYLGLSYITVYVGAIAMLFIFVIMMLNIQILEKSKQKNLLSLPLGLFFGIFFIYPLIHLIPNEVLSLFNFLNLQDVLSKIYISHYHLYNPTIVECVGNLLYTNYSIALLILSLIFVLAMIGSICIAAPKKSKLC